MEKKEGKINRLFMKPKENNEFAFDFMMAYGVVLILMVAVLFINGAENMHIVILDCFVPTTIAFSGTIVIQKTSDKIKLVSPILLLSILFLLAMYIVFLTVNAIYTIQTLDGNEMGTVKVSIAWFVVMFSIVACVWISKHFYPEYGTVADRQDDGSATG